MGVSLEPRYPLPGAFGLGDLFLYPRVTRVENVIEGIAEAELTPFRLCLHVYRVSRPPGFPALADLKLERRIEYVGDVDAWAE